MPKRSRSTRHHGPDQQRGEEPGPGPADSPRCLERPHGVTRAAPVEDGPDREAGLVRRLWRGYWLAPECGNLLARCLRRRDSDRPGIALLWVAGAVVRARICSFA